MPVADFEIADYLYVPEFGKLNMLGCTQAARRVLRHPQPTWKAFCESDRL
jgi:hypothetical protein